MSETTPPTPPRFEWGICIAVFITTLFCGALLNVGAGLLALAWAQPLLGAIVGAAPGILAILLSLRMSRAGASQGMLAAACIVALVGGLCGFGLGHGLNVR
ncbi:MAG TPA: hypothetical protein VJZ00_06125 [Thermoanaerobaculia bacterium]|nr:hypothetical protein [Thermoanaerobaculia bacterium]